MKIVCDACGTRYSIDDRRVAGRSFKVRCKQCAHVIALPGSRAPTAEPAAAGTWHAVIDGIPQPIAVEDLRQLRAAGALDDRALVWREGFDDWRELGSVEELRRTRPASVVVAPELAPEGAPARRPDAAIEGAIEGAVGGATYAGAAPRADAELEHRPGPAPLRGVRHENSVLFSLGSLARLAAPAPATASPAGRTEGSGLLDIRELARSLAPARTERGAAQSVELPVHGALPFGEPAVLIPSSPPRRDRRLVWALAATIGALAAVTVILLVIVLRGGAAAHAGTPPPRSAPPGASPAPTAPGRTPGAAAPEAIAHAEPTAPARTSAEAAAPSAGRTGQAADRTDRTAADPTRASADVAAPSAGRTEQAAAPAADRTDRTAADPTRASAPSAGRTGQAAVAPAADRTDRTATNPTRASADVAAPSADRTERTTASPSASQTEPAVAVRSADRIERAAAAGSADRTEPAASPGQTGHTAASAAHAGSSAAHAAASATALPGPAADAASRRAPRAASLAPAGADACSEITCIVNGYADPCCAIHRRPAAAPAPAGGELPERLDRPAIAGGLARIDTTGCGKQPAAHGDVRVSVQVSPAGAVTGVTVKSSPDPALEACVTAALRKGAFPATRRGGSFGYAWRF